MSGRLIKWFTPQRGTEILKIIQEHLKLTRSATQELSKMIAAASVGDETEKWRTFEKLSMLESNADGIRRSVFEKLTEGEFFPEERGDLMELVKAVDMVADWSREAGRILENLAFQRFPEDLKVAARNMAAGNEECVGALMKSIELLSEHPKEALGMADEVERWEEKMDSGYDQARKILALMNSSPEIPAGQLILLNMFLDATEMVADWSENSADVVRVIAVRMY